VINWQKIQGLRKHYLSLGQAGSKDYWNDLELIESYDKVLGERIAWKWSAVLNQVKDRISFTTSVSVLDWGCGTAVASRKFYEYFGETIVSINLHDRSRKVANYASKRLAAEVKDCNISILDSMPAEKSTVALLSHVINEFDEKDLDRLVHSLRGHELIIWLEPGTHRESRRLNHVRAELLDEYEVIAPCSHQSKCPMQQEEHSSHWCHFFARPPAEAFQSQLWAEAKKHLGIDLRSLPTSFLCLMRKEGTGVVSTSSDSAAVLIGRHRIYKGYLKYLECSEAGLSEVRLQKRDNKKLFKQLSDGVFSMPQTK